MAFGKGIWLRRKIDVDTSQHYSPPAELMRSKSQKQLVLTGAARFNTKPKTGLAFFGGEWFNLRRFVPGDQQSPQPSDFPEKLQSLG